MLITTDTDLNLEIWILLKVNHYVSNHFDNMLLGKEGVGEGLCPESLHADYLQVVATK